MSLPIFSLLHMPTPGEHKIIQARILEYAEAFGWIVVSLEEAVRRRGFEHELLIDSIQVYAKSDFENDNPDEGPRQYAIVFANGGTAHELKLL